MDSTKRLAWDRTTYNARTSIGLWNANSSGPTGGYATSTGLYGFYAAYGVTNKTSIQVIAIQGTIRYAVSNEPITPSTSSWTTTTIYTLEFSVYEPSGLVSISHSSSGESGSAQGDFIETLLDLDAQNKEFKAANQNMWYHIDVWMQDFTIVWSDGSSMLNDSDSVCIGSTSYSTYQFFDSTLVTY